MGNNLEKRPGQVPHHRKPLALPRAAARDAPNTQLADLRAAYARGDLRGALRIAVRFKELGTADKAIRKAWGAINHPSLYGQLGTDPAALIEAGRAALVARYDLEADA